MRGGHHKEQSYGSVRNEKYGRNMQCWQTRLEWDNEAIFEFYVDNEMKRWSS